MTCNFESFQAETFVLRTPIFHLTKSFMGYFRQTAEPLLENLLTWFDSLRAKETAP
jgi:hypothetical protein